MSLQADDDRYAADLAYAHDLTLPQGRKLAELAIHALDPSFAPDSVGSLADPAIAEAYVSSPLGPYAVDESVQRLDELARRAIDDGFDTAGAWFARACVAEHRGDLDAQRAHLAAALQRDAGFRPALVALGFLAFVEGDVRRARRLLAESGDQRVEFMLHTLSHDEPRRSGSRASDHPLSQRANWLWVKAEMWLRRLPQLAPLKDVACRLGKVQSWWDEEQALIDAVRHPLLPPVALLEAGLLRRFLDRLGALLPADERALATTWLPVRHTVWHVEATTPGTSLVMSDLVQDRTVEAINGRVSRCTQPGEVMFGVVVPAGDGWFLPAHPIGLDDGVADHIVDRIAGADDPMAIAVDVYEYDRTEPCR